MNIFEAQKWQKMTSSSQYESKIIVVGNLRAWKEILTEVFPGHPARVGFEPATS